MDYFYLFRSLALLSYFRRTEELTDLDSVQSSLCQTNTDDESDRGSVIDPTLPDLYVTARRHRVFVNDEILHANRLADPRGK